MTFIERERTETLAEHLLRNADHLGLSEDLRSRLLAAFRLEQGPFKDRVARREALNLAAAMANNVQAALAGATTDAVARAAAAQLAALRADHQALLFKADRTRAEDHRLAVLTRKVQAATTPAKTDDGNRDVSAAFVKAQAVAVAVTYSGWASSGGTTRHYSHSTAHGLGVTKGVATRIKARDGLASLLETKAITEDEAKVGLAYRLLFEECGPGSGLGSQLEERPRAIRASTHGAVAHGLLKAYAGVRLTFVEKAVQRADATGRTLTILRAVAGEARTIRSLGGGGNTRAANLEALKRGLRVALAALNASGSLRIRGH